MALYIHFIKSILAFLYIFPIIMRFFKCFISTFVSTCTDAVREIKIFLHTISATTNKFRTFYNHWENVIFLHTKELVFMVLKLWLTNDIKWLANLLRKCGNIKCYSKRHSHGCWGASWTEEWCSRGFLWWPRGAWLPSPGGSGGPGRGP